MWQKEMLSCEFYCSVHFLINAENKAVASHLMWRHYVSFHQKLPSPTLTLTKHHPFHSAFQEVFCPFSFDSLAGPLLRLKMFFNDNHSLLYPSSILKSPQIDSQKKNNNNNKIVNQLSTEYTTLLSVFHTVNYIL